jgi:hypothetical protein
MSPRWNWDSPTPSLTSECAPTPGTKGLGGGGHTRLRVRGWGSPNSDDWRKSLALCLLCGMKSAKVSRCQSPKFFIRAHLSAPSKKGIHSALIKKEKKISLIYQ